MESEYLFRPTDNEYLRWAVVRDGVVLAQGETTLEIAPQGKQQIALTIPELESAPGEVWLNVDVYQKTATRWSGADHHCARDQWRLPSPLFIAPRKTVSSRPTLAVE